MKPLTDLCIRYRHRTVTGQDRTDVTQVASVFVWISHPDLRQGLSSSGHGSLMCASCERQDLTCNRVSNGVSKLIRVTAAIR